MVLVENDRWRGFAFLHDNARYIYTVIAWRDLFATWRDEVTKKHAAGVPIALELTEGRMLVERSLQSDRAGAEDRKALQDLLAALDAATDQADRLKLFMARETAELMHRTAERTNLSRYERNLDLFVDRKAAAFSAWYELMPRSMSDDPNRHGTFEDVIAKLPYVHDLGFDVLYFPPIHPIGRTHRKGKNNTLTPGPDDPGSPYAIGSPDGGHDAIHPELGTFEDFARLVAAAKEHGLEVALDFAIQCSPDHPWIKDHPEWFDWRPDGTIRFAENPPKKYEDIVNVHFYREALPALWYALRDIVLFWVDKGVKIFRVDNPHTKPLPFWEWMIGEVIDRHPDVIFLAEAFTRPKMMKRLAKVGYSQSYSYFTWRNTKAELTQYLTELTTTDARYTMRPNFFVNTPDINPIYLQTSGRAGFRIRLILAASLGGNYGVYSGFELCEAEPVPGKEEYLNSEKYEIKAWEWDKPGHIRPDIRLINRLRRDHPALQHFANVKFYNAWNDNILYYGKMTPAKDDFLLFMVNLDPHNGQGAHFEVPLWEFGLPDEASIDVEDLVTGNRFAWQGKVQHMWLDPQQRPYAIWRLNPPGGAR
jgi:starch synthase (maltosyl-transferring)